jgi:phosphoglycerol transferase MdoB-like AlkP superfamily enzyme
VVAGLTMLLALSAACQRRPPPPYPLSFSLAASSPRLLEASQGVSVPVVVGNDGVRAWDPARIHLSYHWLWIVPRELASRSRWDVPYHTGIRTDLRVSVGPGERSSIEGRVLAPAVPGLYWLQWDMVEEGVTWFCQVAPRQPRTLVVVVPTMVWAMIHLPIGTIFAGMVAPVSLVTALAGLWVLGRRRAGRPLSATARALAAAPDVLWCAAVLCTKPLVLTYVARLEPTAVAYWLTVAVGLLLPLICWLALPPRVRPWVLLAVGVFGSTLVLADAVYYRFFGDVLSAPAILGARQTGRVWESVRTLFSPGLVWLIVDWPFAVWLAVRLSRSTALEPTWRRRAQTTAIAAVVLVAAGVALSAPQRLASTPLDQRFLNRQVVEELGVFSYHGYDAWSYARARWWRPPVTEAQVQDALEWLASRAPLRAGEGHAAFGAARGRNLIVVQVESLQDFAVNFRVDGQDVMPHLRRWTSDSLRFTDVTDQTSEGRTSDAEFTTLTSLLPLDHGAVAFQFPDDHYAALPGVLKEHGYATLSAVPFEPGFWNRRVMHPSYGFQTSLFETDFTMTEAIGWGLNDHDFLQQMVPRLERLPRPFAAWLITLSLHHPFEGFPERHKVLKLGPLEGTSFGNYLHTMRFFDQALEEFRAALAKDGLLDDSLVVVFGDHDAGFVRDAGIARAIGVGDTDAAWALNDRIPLFIRVPRAAGNGLIGERRRLAGQTDFAPTLLALLGVDPAALPYVGRNLLGVDDDSPLPRPYGDWRDSRYLSMAGRAGAVCYDATRQAAVDLRACAAADASARRARAVSRLIVVEDLQQRFLARSASQ